MLLPLIERIFKFNKEIVGISPRDLEPLEKNERKWLWKALNEEAVELDCSTNVVDQVDALCDSIIFATGGFARLGLTEEQAHACLDAVMDANFEKKAGIKEGRIYVGVKDAIKPKGWVGPEARIAEILGVEYVAPPVLENANV